MNICRLSVYNQIYKAKESSEVVNEIFNLAFKRGYITDRCFSFISENEIKMMSDLAKSATNPILDIGCGEGRLVNKLARLTTQKIQGLDFSDKAIQIAVSEFGEKANISFICINMDEFDYTRSRFGLIYSIDSLHHSTDLMTLSANIFNSVVDGGVFVFSMWFDKVNPVDSLVVKRFCDLGFTIETMYEADPELDNQKAFYRLVAENSSRFVSEAEQTFLASIGKEALYVLRTSNLQRSFIVLHKSR